MAQLTLDSAIFQDTPEAQIEELGFAYLLEAVADSPFLPHAVQLADELSLRANKGMERRRSTPKEEAEGKLYNYWRYGPVDEEHAMRDERYAAAVLLGEQALNLFGCGRSRADLATLVMLQSYGPHNFVGPHIDEDEESLSHYAITALNAGKTLTVHLAQGAGSIDFPAHAGDVFVAPTLSSHSENEDPLSLLCAHEAYNHTKHWSHTVQSSRHAYGNGILPAELKRIRAAHTAIDIGALVAPR